MRILVLLMTEVTVGKLAAHRITPDEVRQINDGDHIAARNPRPEWKVRCCSSGPPTVVES